MALQERIALIRKIQEMRGSAVICYLTSLRQNVNAKMAEDAVRIFIDHLLALPFPDRPEKIDLFICSSGGESMVPWRLVPLCRTFAKSFNVLVPFCAYSAATLVALGADEIVMTPFAVLGPIDPTVANNFNPVDKAGQIVGINVEDLQAYIHFVKETVGITQDEQIIKAVELLASVVNPLAIGNVDRFLTQSRMIAKKILNTHMTSPEVAREVDDIVETMTSKLYFHGHPINRREAREELHLKVLANPPLELEGAMWQLYKDYEEEFQNRTIFNPLGELSAAHPINAGPQQQIIMGPGGPMQLPQGQGQGQGQAGPPHRDDDLLVAVVESERLSSKQILKRRTTLITAPGGFQRGALQEELGLKWEQTPVPQAQ